jgi:hypothetical protein
MHSVVFQLERSPHAPLSNRSCYRDDPIAPGCIGRPLHVTNHEARDATPSTVFVQYACATGTREKYRAEISHREHACAVASTMDGSLRVVSGHLLRHEALACTELHCLHVIRRVCKPCMCDERMKACATLVVDANQHCRYFCWMRADEISAARMRRDSDESSPPDYYCSIFSHLGTTRSCVGTAGTAAAITQSSANDALWLARQLIFHQHTLGVNAHDDSRHL